MNPQPPRRITLAHGNPYHPIVHDRWGAGGRPVLLLHGLLFDRTMWWPVAAELATSDCTVVAPDLPGHGESPARADCAPALLAEELADLVHALGLRRAPVVVGHATSAWLAFTLADTIAVQGVITVDEPVTPPAASVDEIVAAANPDAVPGPYRSFAVVRRDPALLNAYASWWRAPSGRRTATAGIALGGGGTPDNEATFRPLVDPAGFADDIRALL